MAFNYYFDGMFLQSRSVPMNVTVLHLDFDIESGTNIIKLNIVSNVMFNIDLDRRILCIAIVRGNILYIFTDVWITHQSHFILMGENVFKTFTRCASIQVKSAQYLADLNQYAELSALLYEEAGKLNSHSQTSLQE